MNVSLYSVKNNITINKIINYLLILLAFVFPISAKKMTGVLVLIIIFWIIEGNWKNKFNMLYNSIPFRYYFAFIVFMGLSLFWSDSIYGGFAKHYPSNGIKEYFKMYFLGFMLVPIMITSMRKEYVKLIVSSFLSAMLVSEFSSWGIYLELIEIQGKIPSNPSPFMHHSLYSIFLTVTIFVLATEVFRVKSLYLKIVMILFMLSSLVNLFLNGGRLGQLAFFISLFVFVFMKFKITFKSIGISLLTVFLIFVLAYKVSPIFKIRANEAAHSIEKMFKGDFNSSWGSRVYALYVAKDIVAEHPLIGIGIGNSKKEFMEKTKEFPQGGTVIGFWHMHNQYMQVLLETGIIGLLLFFLFLFYLLKISLDKEMYILLCTFLTIYMVGFISEPLFWNRQPFMLFNFFIAVFLFFSMHNKDTKGIETR